MTHWGLREMQLLAMKERGLWYSLKHQAGKGSSANPDIRRVNGQVQSAGQSGS
jgi:hypothetical protein